MVHRSIATLAAVFAATLVVTGVAASTAAPQAKPPAAPAHEHKETGTGGWTLPADAEAKKSPLTVDDKVLAAGKSVFKSKCEKCHGPNGLGDGPDADPDHQEDMDLTKSSRAAKNPDGVMYYKVANGRKSPKMPAVKTEGFSKDDVWTVIHFVKTFRPKA